MNLYQKIITPLLFKLDPETAHELAIDLLSYFPQAFSLCYQNKFYPNLIQNLWQKKFSNPIGLAGGFDKNARAIASLKNVGFGFVECGTVTPKAQAGNPKPRIFRLEQEQAIINRLGFNNLGIDCFLNNLKQQKEKIGKSSLQIGINIGKNKDSASDQEDYINLINRCYFDADYLVVNISSPNTANLRQIQRADILSSFISSLIATKDQIELKNNVVHKTPLLLKIAPDLDLSEQEAIASIALDQKIDGLIIANTTVDRSMIRKPDQLEQSQFESGGLSGKPLMAKSTKVLANFYRYTNGKLPLIAVGGISNGADCYQKIIHGANLVQIYTAFIYQGFSLVEKIKNELSEIVASKGFANIAEARGTAVDN